MKELVKSFPAQLKEALGIADDAILNKNGFRPSRVLICGLGGSGIGGSIVSQLLQPVCPVPVQVDKDYFLPAYADKDTLVIISSYSGNTEETINCMDEAVKRNCRIACITSGGMVAETAVKKDLELIRVPAGMPPRACLSYSLVQLLKIMSAYGLAGKDIYPQLKNAVSFIEKQSAGIGHAAKEVAAKLKGRLPVIYCTTPWEGVAIRLRQQLNENAKILCWHHVIPEMNHNELVGWTLKNNDLAVLLLRDREEFPRNDERIRINMEVIRKYTDNICEIFSEGENAVEKTLYLIHFGDWISVHLAELRGVDAVEVRVIDHLKSSLSGKLPSK